MIDINIEDIEIELEYPRIRVKFEQWISFRIDNFEIEFDLIKYLLDNIDIRMECIRGSYLTDEEKKILMGKLVDILKGR